LIELISGELALANKIIDAEATNRHYPIVDPTVILDLNRVTYGTGFTQPRGQNTEAILADLAYFIADAFGTSEEFQHISPSGLSKVVVLNPTYGGISHK
jgi:hypothetical protein